MYRWKGFIFFFLKKKKRRRRKRLYARLRKAVLNRWDENRKKVSVTSDQPNALQGSRVFYFVCNSFVCNIVWAFNCQVSNSERKWRILVLLNTLVLPSFALTVRNGGCCKKSRLWSFRADRKSWVSFQRGYTWSETYNPDSIYVINHNVIDSFDCIVVVHTASLDNHEAQRIYRDIGISSGSIILVIQTHWNTRCARHNATMGQSCQIKRNVQGYPPPRLKSLSLSLRLLGVNTVSFFWHTCLEWLWWETIT